MAQFFMTMIPPTETHQEQKIKVVNNKPVFYMPPEVKRARNKLKAHISRYKPDSPYKGALRLVVKWCFPIKGRHTDGEYRATRPDTDNLQKMLKDVMTDLGFWQDDCQVASEIVEKFWTEIPGIYICVEELEGNKP